MSKKEMTFGMVQGLIWKQTGYHSKTQSFNMGVISQINISLCLSSQTQREERSQQMMEIKCHATECGWSKPPGDTVQKGFLSLWQNLLLTKITAVQPNDLKKQGNHYILSLNNEQWKAFKQWIKTFFVPDITFTWIKSLNP